MYHVYMYCCGVVIFFLRRKANQIYIVMGKEDFRKHEAFETTLSQTRKVKNIFIHPNFEPHPKSINDIAVLELENDFEYTESVQQICLPLPGKGSIIDTIGVALGK